MAERLKQLLYDQNFRPFAIVTEDGRLFRIPSPEHAHVVPGDREVVVFDDVGGQESVSARRIVRIFVRLAGPLG